MTETMRLRLEAGKACDNAETWLADAKDALHGGDADDVAVSERSARLALRALGYARALLDAAKDCEDDGAHDDAQASLFGDPDPPAAPPKRRKGKGPALAETGVVEVTR